jgi:hypothetical protein
LGGNKRLRKNPMENAQVAGVPTNGPPNTTVKESLSSDSDDSPPADKWEETLRSQISQVGRTGVTGSDARLLGPVDHSSKYLLQLQNSQQPDRLDREDLEVLKIRGAFLLPSPELCADLIETYFDIIHPGIPMINRTRFMKSYNDALNPPPLLLLQAIFLAAARVCKSSLLIEAGGTKLATQTFYKRAKALFDVNYSTDKLTIIQSALLMAWANDIPEEITWNVYFWPRVAISIAFGMGLHRKEGSESLSLIERRLWKRLWWGLFARDRQSALAMGRPVMINLEDSDIPLLTEQDFCEDEPGDPSPYPVNRAHALYFIHTVSLLDLAGTATKSTAG